MLLSLSLFLLQQLKGKSPHLSFSGDNDGQVMAP